MPDNPTFQKNLDVLKHTHPDMEKMVLSTQEVPAISLGKTASGEWEISCNFADGVSKPYYGGASPLQYSRDLAGRLKLKNPRILIFMGMGLGHHLIEYARRPHPLNRAIIVLEAFPQVFKKALEVTDLTPLLKSPAVHWFVGSDVEALRRFLNNLFSSGNWLPYANAIEYIPLPSAIEMTPRFYQEAQDLLPQTIGYQFNRFFGDPFDSYLGTKNILANLPDLVSMPSLFWAKDLFKKRPGILIASGPSLTEALPVLKVVGSKCVMAACPSALPALITSGIHPHIWLNIERLEEQGRFFEDLPKKPPHIFVAPPLVHPRCYRGNGGLNTYILGANLQSRWLPHLSLIGEPITDLGHSSAHAAFRILDTLGCNPIFLVGQDLSYADSGSHAAGVWDESRRMMMNLKEADQKIFDIEGNDGQPVKANLFWVTYLKTFADDILPKYRGNVYNVIPKTMGAKIPGAFRIDPAVLPQHLEHFNNDFDPLQILRKTLTPPSPEAQRKMKEALAKKIEGVKRMLGGLISESQKFSLHCKETQFDQDVITKRWERAEKTYRKFLDEVQKYSTRYSEDPAYREDRDPYQTFFHPIVQGLLLRYQIEYFSSAEDLSGDFTEIARKTEILFHMAKDEGYWASACLPLLESSELKKN